MKTVVTIWTRLFLAALAAGGASTAALAHESLGAVDFRVSCAPAVRADFDRAVGYLHHMMYVEAERDFLAIAAKDADCAMAHWGVAVTLFQPLWPTRPSPEALERGWQEVLKAKSLPAPSERERALIAAAEAFFRDPGQVDWWTRIGRWAEAMERAYRAHGDEREIAAFYALSRLAAAQVASDRRPYNEEAAKILLAIHEEEPTHPGAIHYTIHANDMDGRAGHTPAVVRAYGEIAPDVPHALHMPTHIFVRLGDWQETIDWNVRSAAAALKFPAGDTVSHHYLHAVDYQVYAHLQRGEDAAVRALIREAEAKGVHQPTFISAFHLASMPARAAVERRAWKEAAAIEPRTPASIPWDKFLWPEGISWFARGLGAAHTGELAGARAAEARLAALRDAAQKAGEKDFATYIETDRLVLTGWIASKEGRTEEAIARMREAAALEATVEKHPVTPGSLMPPFEALGDLLSTLGRPGEAVEAYRSSLSVWPSRFNSLLGAARAAGQAGDQATARAYYAELLKNEAPGSARDGFAEARRATGDRG